MNYKYMYHNYKGSFNDIKFQNYNLCRWLMLVLRPSLWLGVTDLASTDWSLYLIMELFVKISALFLGSYDIHDFPGNKQRCHV